MVEKITMNVDDVLEFDYQVEEISDNVVAVNKDAGGISESYYSTDTYVFDPQSTGTYELDINGQIIEIEVTDIPDSVIFWAVVEDANATDGQEISTIPDRINGNDWDSQQSVQATYVADGIDGRAAARFDKNDSGSHYKSSVSTSQPTAYVYVVNFGTKDTSTNRYLTDGDSNRNICSQIDNGSRDGIGMWASNWITTSSYSSSPAIYTYDFGINNEIRQNGSKIVSGDPGNNSLDALNLDPGQDVDGLLAEAFVLDNPTSTELRNLESELGSKYNITV